MKKKSLIAALVLMAAASLPALADEYGRHPFYLHALSDLRMTLLQLRRLLSRQSRLARQVPAPRCRGRQGMQHVRARQEIAIRASRRAPGTCP